MPAIMARVIQKKAHEITVPNARPRAQQARLARRSIR